MRIRPCGDSMLLVELEPAIDPIVNPSAGPTERAIPNSGSTNGKMMYVSVHRVAEIIIER